MVIRHCKTPESLKNWQLWILQNSLENQQRPDSIMLLVKHTYYLEKSINV